MEEIGMLVPTDWAACEIETSSGEEVDGGGVGVGAGGVSVPGKGGGGRGAASH